MEVERKGCLSCCFKNSFKNSVFKKTRVLEFPSSTQIVPGELVFSFNFKDERLKTLVLVGIVTFQVV